MTESEIFSKIKEILVSEFEIEESAVTPEARIVDDLDFDSIDAIDLMVKMKAYAPEGRESIDMSAFKTVRTLGDVVQILVQEWK